MRYRAEYLPNGLYRITDRRCHWAGLYKASGTYDSGQCQLTLDHAKSIINSLQAR